MVSHTIFEGRLTFNIYFSRKNETAQVFILQPLKNTQDISTSLPEMVLFWIKLTNLSKKNFSCFF